MSFSPKPCTHCGCTSFHVVPDVMLEPSIMTQVGKAIAGSKMPGWWRLTIVVCTHCTRTEFFTPNVQQLLERFPNVQVAHSTR